MKKRAKPYLLPAFMQCPAYEPGFSDPKGYKKAGEIRHKALDAYLNGDKEPVNEIENEEERDGVVWAAEYILLKAPHRDFPLQIEHPTLPLDGNFEPLFENPGRIDVACGRHLFDLKWSLRDYWAQFAAYAVGRLQEIEGEEVVCHCLYGLTQQARVWKMRHNETLEKVLEIVAAANQPDPPAVPCDYCNWCSRILVCPAVSSIVNRLIDERPDWNLPTYHSSELTDPRDLGAAKTIAAVLDAWVKAVAFRCKVAYTNEGKTPEGYSATMTKGKPLVTDAAEAFRSVGLPQEEFLKSVEVNLKSLTEAYAAFNGLKLAPARRKVEDLLTGIIKRGDPFPTFRKKPAKFKKSS